MGGADWAQGGWKSDLEDALSRGPQGVCKPASPPIAPLRKDLPGSPLLPPCSTHPAWELHHKKVYSYAEGAIFPACLNPTEEVNISINKQSTFPSVPVDLIEKSKATRRQRLCPGRSLGMPYRDL